MIKVVVVVKMVVMIVFNMFCTLFSYTVTHCDRIYGEWIFRQIFKGKLKRIQYTSNTIAIVSRAIKLTNILIPIVCRKMMEC
jgi:hypothetical protein